MLGGRKFLGLLSLFLLLMFTMPAFAADRDVDPQMDLHGLPRLSAHRWMAATAGGAGIGAALGVLVGGGNDITKGILFGGGAASSLYLMSHRNTASGWRDWAFIGSNAALGTGIGWRLRRWRSSWRSDWGWRNGVLARLRRTTGRTGCSNQCQADRPAGHQPLVTIAHRITRRKALAQECGERFLCGTGGKRLTTGVS